MGGHQVTFSGIDDFYRSIWFSLREFLMQKAPIDGSILWTIMWWFFWLLRPLLCKLQPEGIEHVPRSGGFVLASNHFTRLDFLVNIYACPRQIHFMAKKELFEISPPIAWA
jgi:1-acyl-sn-glycerol-3-phosphate acyltransferase